MSRSPHVSPFPRSRGRRRDALLRLAAAALAAVTVLTAAACTGPASAGVQTEDGKTVLRYQGSTGTVGFPELAEYLGYYKKVKLDWIGDVTGGPASIQAAATGQTEFGSAFNGAIIKLRSSGAKITSVLASYGSDEKTYGGFYTLAGSPLKTAKDLIGKKIGVNTLGAQSEFVVKEWLSRQGLTSDEIKKVELVVVPPANAEQSLRAHQVDVAALSGVIQQKALAHGGLTKLFSEVDLFGTASYGAYVFRDEFIKDHSDAVEDFVQGTARAIRWTQTQPADTVRAAFTKIIEARHRGTEDTSLVQYWKSSSVAGAGGVIKDSEFSVWVDWLVRSGDLKKGELTTADLYTNKFNPYSNGTFPADSGPDGKPLTGSRPTSTGSSS